MREPVNIETGHTFEKKAISKWINKSLKSGWILYRYDITYINVQ